MSNYELNDIINREIKQLAIKYYNLKFKQEQRKELDLHFLLGPWLSSRGQMNTLDQHTNNIFNISIFALTELRKIYRVALIHVLDI